MKYFALALLFACDGGGVTGRPPTDSTVDTDDVTPTVPTPVELLCDDQTDDDMDGDIDCDDSDCAEDRACLIPTSLDYRALVMFDSDTIFASDCQYEATAVLERDREQSCADCERVYCGDFVVVQDNCPEDEGADRPPSGCYGVAFEDDAWTVKFQNEMAMTYEDFGIALGDGAGEFMFTRTDPVIFEGANVGSLRGTYTFSETP